MKRVTGIGGLFFKTNDLEGLKAWYKKHLGIDAGQYGATFFWKTEGEAADAPSGSTVWSPFEAETDYFSPSEHDYMFNYRVENLEWLLGELQKEGVTIVGEMETYDYGKFGWILDLEGRKIELWEPVDGKFEA